MISILAAAAALVLGSSDGSGGQAGRAKPSREDLSDMVMEQTGEPPQPYIPTGLKEPGPDAPSRFDDQYGLLHVILLDDKVHPSMRGGRSLWALTQDLVYWPSNGNVPIIVPRGFVTDLASIPRPLWSWLPPDGPWAKAAVIHDFLYYTQGQGVWKCHDTTLQRSYSKDEADWILRDAQADRHVGVVSRNIVWLGVHLGGQAGWDASPGIKNITACKSEPKLPPKPASKS
jgi:hypothetical protein